MKADHTVTGNSWSGRMKYLLNCRSVLMSHKLEWKEFYHHLLVPSGPDQNYVELALDFSDLPERMDYYLKNLNEAERIAENSVQTFRRRYLSPAAEACYWRRLIHGWAEVQGFEPELYEEEHLQNNSGQAKKINGLRGKPFEGFRYVPLVHWQICSRKKLRRLLAVFLRVLTLLSQRPRASCARKPLDVQS